MGSRSPHAALQLIFAFFLGLMVTAFVGVGVYTFHPHHLEPFQEQARVLNDEKQLIIHGRGVEGLTAAQREEVRAMNAQLREIDDARRAHEEDWARTSSIILLGLATLVMGVSLTKADQLPVINNGLLLGGVFTMLYGTGWILVSGASQLRFWVLGFALLLTLALGYLRFVRARTAARDRTPSAAADARLAERVDALEHRLGAVSEALRGA